MKTSLHFASRFALALSVMVSLAAAGAGSAAALEIAGVQFPEKAKVGEKALTLNGVGLRTKTIFAVKVYAAGLYLQNPTQDSKAAVQSDQLKRLDLVFLRDIDKETLIKAFKDGFEDSCQPLCQKLNPQFNDLASAISDSKKWDKIEFIFYPDKLIVGQASQRRDILGRDFGKAILKIFLGDHPPTDELKSGLLGHTKG